jgi:hypothetical protein
MAAPVTAISSGTMCSDVITLHARTQDHRTAVLPTATNVSNTKRGLCMSLCLLVHIYIYVYLSKVAYVPVSFQCGVIFSAPFSFLTCTLALVCVYVKIQGRIVQHIAVRTGIRQFVWQHLHVDCLLYRSCKSRWLLNVPRRKCLYKVTVRLPGHCGMVTPFDALLSDFLLFKVIHLA